MTAATCNSASTPTMDGADANGRCPRHPYVELRRKSGRTGRWVGLLDVCPLCRADDEEEASELDRAFHVKMEDEDDGGQPQLGYCQPCSPASPPTPTEEPPPQSSSVKLPPPPPFMVEKAATPTSPGGAASVASGSTKSVSFAPNPYVVFTAPLRQIVVPPRSPPRSGSSSSVGSSEKGSVKSLSALPPPPPRRSSSSGSGSCASAPPIRTLTLAPPPPRSQPSSPEPPKPRPPPPPSSPSEAKEAPARPHRHSIPPRVPWSIYGGALSTIDEVPTALQLVPTKKAAKRSSSLTLPARSSELGNVQEYRRSSTDEVSAITEMTFLEYNDEPASTSQSKRSSSGSPLRRRSTDEVSEMTDVSFMGYNDCNDEARSVQSESIIDTEAGSAVDAHGRCVQHPRNRLRKKKMLGGWRIVMRACPDCCVEELRWARVRNGMSDEIGATKDKHKSKSEQDIMMQPDREKSVPSSIRLAKSTLQRMLAKPVVSSPPSSSHDRKAASQDALQQGSELLETRLDSSDTATTWCSSGSSWTPVPDSEVRESKLAKAAIGDNLRAVLDKNETRPDDRTSDRTSAGTSPPTNSTKRTKEPKGRRRRPSACVVQRMAYTDPSGKRGLYSGEVDDGFQPHGNGIMEYGDGTYGYSSRVEGVWRNGRYRGSKSGSRRSKSSSSRSKSRNESNGGSSRSTRKSNDGSSRRRSKSRSKRSKGKSREDGMRTSLSSSVKSSGSGSIGLAKESTDSTPREQFARSA